MSVTGLSENELKLIESVFQMYPQVEKAYVFGSRAKGNFQNNSDVDIAVFGRLDDLLVEEIAYSMLELPLPYKFDIQCYDLINNIALKSHIDRNGIQIYTK